MDKKSVKFTSTPLSLPLFMNKRNRIRQEESARYEKHLKKNIKLYTKNFSEENELNNETATLRDLKHRLGVDPFRVQGKPCEKRPLPICRDVTRVNNWQMAPNRYTVTNKYYDEKKGSSGAYWPKKHTSQRREVTLSTIDSIFHVKYEKLRYAKLYLHGSMAIDLRSKRPTERVMVSNILTCYKDPTEPTPTTYVLPSYFGMTKCKKSAKYVPDDFRFYRYTTIPVKTNVIHSREMAKNPAIGRYETRFPNVCNCFGGKLHYETDLQRLIDINKRNKFRRKPYKRIKISQYCSPELRHIKGNGFRYLFRQSNIAAKKLSAQDKKKAAKVRTAKVRYADARYIQTINNPQRTPISLRTKPLPRRPVKVHFNTMEKRIVRKQLRMNKKIAFGSGKERFDDDPKLSSIVRPSLQDVMLRLPVEKRLRHYPITNTPIADIQSKYKEPVKRIHPQVEVRKREFKFPPLPEAKILCRPSAFVLNYDPNKSGFYLEKLKPEDFFK